MSQYGSSQLLLQKHEQQPRSKGNTFKWEELKKFFYNPDEKEIFGRTAERWQSFSLIYGTLYLLTIIFMIIMAMFLSFVYDEIAPYRRDMETPLQLSPGLTHRPVSDFESTLIRFIQGKPSTYKPHADHITTFLEEYENEAQVGENFVDCSLGKFDENKVCRFNVDQLGDKCLRQRDFGFDEGKPCILLKLNKIYEWRPELYVNASELPPESGDLHTRFHSEYIGVTCDGRYDADFENVGNITYYPEWGFSTHFYPYLNQEGFRSPLVMARFENPTAGVVINVECKAWAKNIKHHTNDKLGTITFELLVD